MRLHLTVILAITFCFNFTVAGYYPQYLQAYRYKSCLGPATNFLETNSNGSGFIFKSESMTGLWRLVDDAGRYIVLVPYSSISRSCLTTVEPKTYKSVNKLAVGDFDDSVLTLYPLALFEGEPLVIDEHGVSKVEYGSFNIGSWAITGSQSFTVFDGENFEGNATCLEVDRQANINGMGISAMFEVQAELSVRSAKEGCTSRKNRRLRGTSEQSILPRDVNGRDVKDDIIGKLEILPEVIAVK